MKSLVKFQYSNCASFMKSDIYREMNGLFLPSQVVFEGNKSKGWTQQEQFVFQAVAGTSRPVIYIFQKKIVSQRCQYYFEKGNYRCRRTVFSSELCNHHYFLDLEGLLEKSPKIVLGSCNTQHNSGRPDKVTT